METCRERHTDDPILKRSGAELDEISGNRLKRVVLFGSRGERLA
jgi:hypothetical protein